ncbi:hypothetical protein ACFOY2_05405 [Nonomuraea purpurea]|uniref:Tape measure protein n=1 Tax=Nonomuraea purpurea TaxID=1849276 RepID=A0ABV8FY15_9ACTN
MVKIADRSVSVRLRLKIKEFEVGANGVKKNLTGLNKKFAETAGFAQGFRRKLEDATKKLPKIEIDANSKPADIKLAELRSKLEALSKKEIGVDIDASQALVEMAALQRELEAVEHGASFDVKADVGNALADLNAINREVQRLDGQKVEIDIEADRTFADRLRAQVEMAARSLPKIELDANSTSAQAKITELRAALVGLADKRIGVDLDSAAAMAQIAALERELAALTKSNDIDVRVNAGSALAELRAISAEVNRVDGKTARVNVNADVGGALMAISLVGAALASLPAVTTIAVGVGALAGAFTAAGAGAAGFAAVAVPSLGRINEALKQQESAAGGAGGATKSAAQSAAEAASRALQLEQAERRVTDAQKGVKAAQEDLTRARQDAKRAIEDYALSVKDAALAEEDAALSVEEARVRLAEVQADPKATDLERQRAELNYRQAVQRLEDQRVRTKRLQEDKAAADKKGIEGSDQVRSAQDKLIKAQADLAEAQKQLTVLQLQQRAAMQQAGGAAGGAASKFAELSKAEQALAKDIKKFQDSYVAWQRSLQPDVFPVIRSGLDLLNTGMKTGTPLIKASAGAFKQLIDQTNKGLQSEQWTSFFDDLTEKAPRAIEGLGASAGNVAGGLAGVIQAFLPYTDDLMTFLEDATQGFENWGQSLKGSPEFEAFVRYVQEQGPKVGEVLGNIAEFVGKILSVGAGAAPGVLDFLVNLSEKLASMDPGQIEAVATGVGLIFAAAKLGATLKLGAFVLLADVLSKMSPGQIQALAVAIAATVAAVKGYQAISGAAEWWHSLSGSLDKAGASADTAKGKLGGLKGVITSGGGMAAIVAGAAIAVDQLSDNLGGLNPDVELLAQRMTDLSAKGQPTAQMLNTFGSNLDTLAADMSRSTTWFAPTVGQFESLGDTVKRLNSDNPFMELGNNIAGLTDSFYTMDTGRQRLENFDKTLTQMVQSGNSQEAARLVAELGKQSGLTGTDVDKLRALLPGYSQAVKAAGSASTEAASGVDQAKQRLDGFNQSLTTFSSRTDALQALQNMKTAYNEAEKAIEAASGKLQVNTRMTDEQRNAVVLAREKFAAYIESVRVAADGAQTLSGRTTDGTRTILEQLPQLSALAGKNQEAREQILKLAEAYGISREDANKAMTSAKGLRDMLAQLKSKEIEINANTEKAKQALRDLLNMYIKPLEIPVSIRKPQAAGGLFPYAAGGFVAAASGMQVRPQPPQVVGKPTVLYGEGSSGQGATEAFIPYEAKFRDRAVALLGQVANDFGLTLNNQRAAENLSALSVTIDSSGLQIASGLEATMGALQSTMGQAGSLTSTIGKVGSSADQLNASWIAGSQVVNGAVSLVGQSVSGAADSMSASIGDLASTVDALSVAISQAEAGASGSKPTAKGKSGKGGSTSSSKGGMVAGSGPSQGGLIEGHTSSGYSTGSSGLSNYSRMSAPQQMSPGQIAAFSGSSAGAGGAPSGGTTVVNKTVTLTGTTIRETVDADVVTAKIGMVLDSRG